MKKWPTTRSPIMIIPQFT